MSLSNTAETAILALIFNATAWANVADNAGTSPLTDLAVGLKTADPTDTGDMATSEVTYTSYARQDIARGGGGWGVSGNVVNPAANIDFPNPGDGTGLPQTATHFSVGFTGGGAVDAIFHGTVTPNITIDTTGVTPRLTTATAITLD